MTVSDDRYFRDFVTMLHFKSVNNNYIEVVPMVCYALCVCACK